VISHEVFRRRRLPHWDVPGAIYFVTACLRDSIPAQGLLEIEQLRNKLLTQRPPPELSVNEWKARQWKLTFACADDWLDARPAARHLEDPRLAVCVDQALAYFEGHRYELYAYVIMPSHFHWLFRPLDAWVATLPGGPALEPTRGAGFQPAETIQRQVENLPHDERAPRTPRERIMHSIKRHSARECNKLLGARGPFWQDESYDHGVFDIEELGRIVEYVELNPVRAGLVRDPEDWPFSSARYRLEQQVPVGQPLGRRRGAGFQPTALNMAAWR
jgi:putative transposase